MGKNGKLSGEKKKHIFFRNWLTFGAGCGKVSKVVRTTYRKAGIHLTLARCSDLG